MSHPPRERSFGRSLRIALAMAGLTVAAGACAGAARTTTATDVASEAEWRALSVPRPDPLPGAPRVTVSGIDFLGSFPWSAPGTVTPALGVEELVAAGLLRRRDVRFVERRRFSAAVESVRRGIRRPPGAPPPGVSQSAEFMTTAAWIPTASGQATVEVRLAVLQTGGMAGATRVIVPDDADPVTLARAIVDGLLSILEDLDRLPTWVDPLRPPADAPSEHVSADALRSFFAGLASEEVWEWEGARRGYQAAAADPAFHEASTALARAARLRLGGTLGES